MRRYYKVKDPSWAIFTFAKDDQDPADVSYVHNRGVGTWKRVRGATTFEELLTSNKLYELTHAELVLDLL